MDVREYAKAFNKVERDYEHAVAAFGVPFEAAESCSRTRRAHVANTCGCHCEHVFVAWLDISGMLGVSHRRAHGNVLH